MTSTLLMALALVACGDPEPPAPTGEPIPLAAPRLLRRVSLDLRGVLPSVEELDAVEADPAQVDAYRDAWLDDPRLQTRLVELFAEQWRTRVDEFDARWYDFGYGPEDDFRFDVAVGEEPLRLLAHVATNDLPWSETVTADYTLANPLLAEIWPVTYPDGASGWQLARYTDGRPAAGVLSTNGLWWRYSTNPFNDGRSRAGAILRHLLCEDFLARPVSFSAAQSAAASGDSANAVRTEPYCLACHAVVDPLAATTFGFWWRTQYNAIEMRTYHAEREPLGMAELGVAPAYFGAPLDGLADLGRHIAADPRFARCAAETAGSMLLRRTLVSDDFDAVSGWLDAFHAGDLRYKALLRAITNDPLYRAGTLPEGVPQSLVARAATTRLQSVDQLRSSLAELTGWVWTIDDVDMLGIDTVGYRVLGGGVDGETVLQPAQDPSVTWALVVERLAQGAASSAVDAGLGAGLLAGVGAGTEPGGDAFAEQVAQLHWRLYGVRADAAFVADAAALWAEARTTEGSPEGAWGVLLSAMLRDPLWVGT